MTLTANAIRGGGTLSGYNCFTIDEGSAQAETICGTISGTTVSSLSRGISQSTGTTTVASLQFSHRRGANVKITDFPIIQILKAQANGEDTYPNLIYYASGTDCSVSSPGTAHCAKAYIDSVVVAGASNANETTKGISELGTQIEAASTTSTGSTGARLVIPASMATSSPGTAGLWAVITNNAGKIAQAFFDLTASTTYSGHSMFTATTSIKANSVTASPAVFNGVPYAFPSTQATVGSSTLMNDGTGVLKWGAATGFVVASTSYPVWGTAMSSTTVFNYTVPANTLNAGTVLRAKIYFSSFRAAGTSIELDAAYGYATSTIKTGVTVSQNNQAVWQIDLVGLGGSSQVFLSTLSPLPTTTSMLANNPYTAIAKDPTQSQLLQFQIGGDSTDVLQPQFSTLEIIR